MPISPVTKLYSTEDAKIAKLTSDVEGYATYETAIDVPGIRSVGLTPQIESKQLRGDNRELDADSTLVAVEVTFEQAKVSFEALTVLIGGTWNSTTGIYAREGGDVLPQWKIVWKTPDGGGDLAGGAVHFEVTKCRLTNYTLGTAFEDYQILSGTARGVYRLADDRLFSATVQSTAAAISA